MAKLLAHGRRERPSVVLAGSVATLPAAVLASRLFGATLLYDAAELETEKFIGAPVKRLAAKVIERVLIGRVATVFVVCDSIADWYQDRYGITRPRLVRNVPSASQRVVQRSGRLRDALGVGDDTLVFLYQGALFDGRGIPTLLAAAERLEPGRIIAFLGFGQWEPKIREAAAKNPRVRILSAVPPETLTSYTVDADMGLVVIEDACLNYRYCLPNKLFEAMLCGVPVAVSPLPELTRYVTRRRSGFVVELAPDKVAAFLNERSREELEAIRARLVAEPVVDCWENERRIVVETFRAHLIKSTSATSGPLEALDRQT
jgi:glycosyltransferase involved in cell wall biosynthesis